MGPAAGRPGAALLATTVGQSKTSQVSEWLTRQISSGDWPIDSRIPTESELSEQLGVGRSTVREATRSLVSIGMLESAPGRGTFVRSRHPVSAHLREFFLGRRIEDVLALRHAIEVEAAGLAAAHRTDEELESLRRAHRYDLSTSGLHAATDPAVPEPTASRGPRGPEGARTPAGFHAGIMVASHNLLLAELYQGVVSALRRAVANGDLVASPDHVRRCDHARLLEAIAAGDAEQARAAADAHADHDLLPPD